MSVGVHRGSAVNYNVNIAFRTEAEFGVAELVVVEDAHCAPGIDLLCTLHARYLYALQLAFFMPPP